MKSTRLIAYMLLIALTFVMIIHVSVRVQLNITSEGNVRSQATPPRANHAASGWMHRRGENLNRLRQRFSCYPAGDVNYKIRGAALEEVLVAQWAHNLGYPRNWTIVDVGINKGWTVVKLLDALGVGKRNLARMMAAHLFDFAERHFPELDFYARSLLCHDCTNVVSPVASSPVGAGAVVFGYDGQSSYVLHFLNFTKQLLSSSAVFSVVVKHLALSNRTSIGSFYTEGFGTETSSLTGSAIYGTGFSEMVSITTIDRELGGSVPHVDILVTDTEGHDLHVLEGASDFLSNGRVSLYVLELHKSDKQLSDSLSFLLEKGYFCVIPVRKVTEPTKMYLLFALSPPCRGTDGARGWSNAICVNLNDTELVDALLEVSMHNVTDSLSTFDEVLPGVCASWIRSNGSCIPS